MSVQIRRTSELTFIWTAILTELKMSVQIWNDFHLELIHSEMSVLYYLTNMSRIIQSRIFLKFKFFLKFSLISISFTFEDEMISGWNDIWMTSGWYLDNIWTSGTASGMTSRHHNHLRKCWSDLKIQKCWSDLKIQSWLTSGDDFYLEISQDNCPDLEWYYSQVEILDWIILDILVR